MTTYWFYSPVNGWKQCSPGFFCFWIDSAEMDPEFFEGTRVCSITRP
jgi:hypothetical protein